MFFNFLNTLNFLTTNQNYPQQSQKKVHSTMKKLISKLPKNLISKPKSRWRSKLYEFTTSDKFEINIIILTLLNLVLMAIDHDTIGASQFQI